MIFKAAYTNTPDERHLCLELLRNIRLKIRKSQKKIKQQTKKLRDKFMVGVVLGLHRLFFCLQK